MAVTIRKSYYPKETTTAQLPTSVLQYGGFSAFLETFVLDESSGIFSSFSAENPPHRKAENRWQQG
jgi:hypothetical protein